MSELTVLAYLAGVVDSDGYIRCKPEGLCHGDVLLRAVQEIRSRPAWIGGVR